MSLARRTLSCVFALAACADHDSIDAGETSSASTSTTTAVDTSSTTVAGSSSSSDSTGEPLPCVEPELPEAIAWAMGPDTLAAGSTDRQGYMPEIAIDAAGNVFVAVTLEHAGVHADVLVSSFTPDGGTRWELQYDGAASLDDRALAIAALDDGSVYAVLSEVTSELNVREGPIIAASMAVLRIGADAERLWRLERAQVPGLYPGIGGEPFAVAALGPDDHLVLVHHVPYSSEPDDLPMLLELDRLGNVVRERAADESDAVIFTGIAVDSDGHVVLARDELSDVTEVVMTTLDGAPVWSLPLDGRAPRIAITATDDVYVSWRSSADDWRVARHGHDGTLRWMAHVDSEDVTALASECSGGVLLGGTRNERPRLVAYDGDGVQRWATAIDPGMFWSTTLALAYDPAGGILLGGLAGPPSGGLGPWLGRLSP